MHLGVTSLAGLSFTPSTAHLKIQLGYPICQKDKVEPFWNTHNISKISELIKKCNNKLFF